MKNDYKPLVSVAVVTYNSSKTVLETLDSIYNQTYPNLELIVSDDCSTDNTVKICRDWIETHKDRFVRTELLTFEKNTGVSANMNRGADACRGEWVKDIAGDDILLPDCVDTYVDYVSEHQETVIVFSNVEVFGGGQQERIEVEEYYSIGAEVFSLSIKEQYDFITLERNWILAPTAFYNRAKVIALGIRNDERIPFYEDVPKWIRFLKVGVRLGFIDKNTVKYRVSSCSVSHTTDFKKSVAKCYIYYRFQNDFIKKSKKQAVLKWLRAQRVIHDNAFVWRAICKFYRTIFNVK